ncbi:MAG: hypothetical protein ACI4PO_07940 [Faecousia sp.]
MLKKTIAILLLLAMALSLCACGANENKYAKYDYINEMLERGDFDGAMMAIDDLRQQAQGGSENNSNNGGGEDTLPPSEPTQEEWNRLWEYYNILRNLNSYLEGSSISVYDQETDTSYSGSGALEYYYNRLSGMETIDKWVGTEYISPDRFSEEINWDRKAVLEGFVIVKDVKLSENWSKTDNMGNVSTNNHTPWTYDENGVLIRQGSEYYVDRITYSNYNDGFQPEYDDSGRLIQKKYGSGDTVNALETFTYDAAGCLTNIHIKDNNGEHDYACTCDGQGRLTQIAWSEGYSDFTITYTYDAAGHLVKEEKTLYNYYDYYKKTGKFINTTWTFEYVYDGNNLTTGTYTYRGWGRDIELNAGESVISDNYPYSEQQNRYDYTCDDAGRVIVCSVTPGNKVYIRELYGHEVGDILNTPDYANATIETVYGDYYIYSPKN